ncbi:hypothetical protein C8Q77DRAFT_1115473 [Trametes polyzona]|nr:hypothetical protein C8Q77DRAFT_1115473 [Trametes polyzona]
MPLKRAPCQVCAAAESKYTCAKCAIVYCSVACYKSHQTSCSNNQATARTVSASTAPLVEQPPDGAELRHDAGHNTVAGPPQDGPDGSAATLEPDKPLRSLASLKWPYVPEESAFPDPLKRDDPKPLQLPQYEAIATSPAIRRVIASNPRLREILRSIDALRGEERELALHEALGIGESRGKILLGRESEEDRAALRELAEAVEGAVRGGKQGVLGLDWGD